MYLQDITGVLQSHQVKIKYDCDGGFESCGQEKMIRLKYAEKNFRDNEGKHVCRKCFMTFKNPGKDQKVKDKIKKTNLERYGSTLPINQEFHIEQRRERFKDEEFKKQWIEKHKKTSLEKYGVEHPMHTEECKKKQRQTLKEKYGVEVPLQSEEIKKRAKETNLRRYGVENVAQSPEIRAKMAQTTFERYGVEHYNQLPEMREYLRQNCSDWLGDSWKNPWAKGIQRPEEWNQKQSQTMTDKVLSGEFNPEDKRFYLTGHYRSNKCKKPKAFFRSSLELIMHFVFDNDDNVIWYENEPFSIQYEKSSGIIRNYVPDFFVFRKVGLPFIAEIKPAFRMREKQVESKVDAAQKFCQENGFEFLYIDEIFIRSKKIDLAFVKSLPQVEILITK